MIVVPFLSSIDSATFSPLFHTGAWQLPLSSMWPGFCTKADTRSLRVLWVAVVDYLGGTSLHRPPGTFTIVALAFPFYLTSCFGKGGWA
jgi:hypothetical protein